MIYIILSPIFFYVDYLDWIISLIPIMMVQLLFFKYFSLRIVLFFTINNWAYFIQIFLQRKKMLSKWESK